jgi:hypothetical protein
MILHLYVSDECSIVWVEEEIPLSEVEEEPSSFKYYSLDDRWSGWLEYLECEYILCVLLLLDHVHALLRATTINRLMTLIIDKTILIYIIGT